jgi:hypothetical protein
MFNEDKIPDPIASSKDESDADEDKNVPITGEQKMLLAVFMFSMAVSQTTRQNATSLFPSFVYDEHPKFSEFMIGVLLCAY